VNILGEIINSQYNFFNDDLKEISGGLNRDLNNEYYNKNGNKIMFNDVKFAKIMMGKLNNNSYPNNITKNAYRKIIN